MWRNPEQPRVEASPGFLLLLGALFWLDGGVGLLPWGLLACIVHELGHIAAALACGGRVERLSLTMVGAELSFSYRTPLSYGRDSLVALAGPGANLLLGGLFFWQGRHLPAVLTLGLGVFNLLPIRPLDGGRALYLLASWAAGPAAGEAVCRWAGTVTAAALAALIGGVIWRTGGSLWLLPALFAGVFWSARPWLPGAYV